MESVPHVLVIGGGPAGSTAAALLAKSGVKVTLLERDKHPRYHIGESLLASVLSTLRLSGAHNAVAAHGFQIKRGGVFLWQNDTWILDWDKLVDAEAWSWQVDRAEFDELLLRNATAQGAEVIERATVKNVLFGDGRPTAVEWVLADEDEVRTTTFDFLIDASGRAGVLAHKHFNMRRQHAAFRNIAIWSYWRGARLDPRSPEGAINVVSTPEGGWIWNIPLSDGRNSVGYVISAQEAGVKLREHGSRESYYHDVLQRNSAIRDLLDHATQVDTVRAEQDYSYVSDTFCGPGYAVIGDAACFLDPLLSTGVHLATYGALVASAAIATTLRGEMPETEALAFFDYTYRRAYSRFLVLVQTMYEEYVGSKEYFAHASNLTEGHATDTPEESFTRIIAGLTDVGESAGEQERAATDTIVTAAEALSEEAAEANIRYMGGIDMSPVWNHWRDPIGPDTVMGEVRITTEPVLGLTSRPRSEAEITAVARPVIPPKVAGHASH